MKRIRTRLLFAACLAVMVGCVKDDPEIKEFKYTRIPNLAAPIFHANVDYNGIFKHLAKNKPDNNAKVEFDEDGLIYLIYKKDYQVTWNSVAEINDIYWAVNQAFPTIGGMKIEHTATDRIKMNSDDTQRFDTIVISQSTMTIKAERMNADGDGVLSFKELTKDGKALEVKWKLSDGTEQTIDVAGYKITPKQEPGLSYMTANINLNGTATSTSTTSRLNIEMTMSDIVPQVIFGYFGTKNALERETSMGLDFFQSHEFPAEIKFTGAFVKLDVNNWTGTPFNLTMDDKFLVRRNNDSIPVRLLKDSALFIDQINYTNYRADGKYDPKHNFFLIDSTNSDLDAILSQDPTSYDYTLRIITNPSGEVGENFLTEEAKLIANAEVYIPFWLQVNELTRDDTIDFDINNIILDANNADFVDTMALYFDFNNGFPLTLWSQAYLADENLNIIDSLFNEYHEQIWNSPQFDDNKRISNWTKTSKRVALDTKKIKTCSEKNVKKILLHTSISTVDCQKQFLKFYKEYGLTMDFSFEILSQKK